MLRTTRILLPSLVLVLAAATSALAQPVPRLKVKARLSPEPAVKDARIPTNILPASDRTLMILRNKEGGAEIQSVVKATPTLELYDREKLGRIRELEPVLRVKAGPIFLEDVVLFGGQPVMVAARRDTVQGIVEVYWQTVDPTLTRRHAPFERLTAFDAKVWGTGKRLKDDTAYRDEFFTAISPDGRHMAIYSGDVVDNDGQRRRLMVMVDTLMHVQWQQNIEVDAGTSWRDVQVDTTGTVVAVVQKGSSPSQVQELVRVNSDGIEEMEPELDGNILSSVLLKPVPDGRLLCAAILADEKGRANSHVLWELDPTGSSFKQVALRTIEHEGDNMAYTDGAMRAMDVLQRSNGGYFLVAEYYLESDKFNAKVGMKGPHRVHGPLLVSCLDAQGAEEWKGTVLRLYYTEDPNVGPALATVFEDEFYVFMLDSEELAVFRKELARGKSERTEMKYTDLKTIGSVYAWFEPGAELKTKAILSSSGANDYVLGQRIYNFGPGECYFLGANRLSGNRFQPVKVEFSY